MSDEGIGAICYNQVCDNVLKGGILMGLRPWVVLFSLFLVIAYFPGILVFFAGMILLLILFMFLLPRVFFTRVYMNHDKRWSQSQNDTFHPPFAAEQEEPIKAEDYSWEEEGDIVDLPPSALHSTNEKNRGDGGGTGDNTN